MSSPFHSSPPGPTPNPSDSRGRRRHIPSLGSLVPLVKHPSLSTPLLPFGLPFALGSSVLSCRKRSPRHGTRLPSPRSPLCCVFFFLPSSFLLFVDTLQRCCCFPWLLGIALGVFGGGVAATRRVPGERLWETAMKGRVVGLWTNWNWQRGLGGTLRTGVGSDSRWGDASELMDLGFALAGKRGRTKQG